ncbi:branched-chain amino acid aminotransferase [Flavobacteriaceae bacterium]|jgi:branched-chain amino acid aminotransferase|nr:branched-chain amino acid aminotransferase [Flavobacteriaceae bacterium]MDC3246120.1 branched-chain amino acid aminotransferase [Flavobacteriaceae bacterium]
MKIEKIKESRINTVDFKNLDFGGVFTDHMYSCDFIDGEWINSEITPYKPITVSPASRVFHYGQACFEGMKAFKDNDDKTWLFRPVDNYERITKSSKRLAMPEFPKDLFFNALHNLLKIDADWIKPGFGNSLYIRPFIFASEGTINATEAKEYKFMIICAPASSYYSGEVRVKIEKSFSRAAKGGVGYAKAAGNYAAQFYPTILAKNEGYQQIIWTDSSTHEYIEEAGTMNLFFRIGDKLITAPTSDSILDGITRKSLIQIARDENIDVEIRPLLVSELIDAANNGSLIEIFGSGTAVVVLPILGFGYENNKYELPIKENSWANLLKNKLNNIQYNLSNDPYGWTIEV